MAANPLLEGKKSTDGHIPWTAMQYYHRAVETGKADLAKLWLAEAHKRGEIVDPSEPRR